MTLAVAAFAALGRDRGQPPEDEDDVPDEPDEPEDETPDEPEDESADEPDETEDSPYDDADVYYNVDEARKSARKARVPKVKA